MSAISGAVPNVISSPSVSPSSSESAFVGSLASDANSAASVNPSPSKSADVEVETLSVPAQYR